MWWPLFASLGALVVVVLLLWLERKGSCFYCSGSGTVGREFCPVCLGKGKR